MTFLTSEILDNFPLSRYASTGVIQRGKKYFRDDKVYEISVNGADACCLVEGSYDDDYNVDIHLAQNGGLRFSCDCPHAAQVTVCKHIVASFLAVSDVLKTTANHKQPAPRRWEDKLFTTLENLPKAKKQKRAKPYVALFLLHRDRYHYGLSFSLSARVITNQKWIKTHALEKTSAEIREMLETKEHWFDHPERPYNVIKPAGCLNLPPEGVLLFNLILQESSYYSGTQNFAAYLSQLASFEAPILLVDGYHELQGKLDIHSEEIEIKAALVQNKNGYMIQAGVELDGKIYTSAKDNLAVVSDDPAWVLIGEKLVSVSNPASLPLLSAFPLQIPFEDEAYFRKNYLPEIATHLPIEGDQISYADVEEAPIPRLYLRKDQDELVAELRFGYGIYETPAEKNPDTVKMEDVPDSWDLVRIHRQPERELEIYGMIKGATFGLKRAGSAYTYGDFLLRARTHPYDFLTQSIPALTEAGFEIYGDKDTLGKLNKKQTIHQPEHHQRHRLVRPGCENSIR
jgi:non-specific serine/threonine protein kinase